jgi:hypothetical protein
MDLPCVHTIGMLFSFDLVLIDKDFKVVGVRELLRPFRITMPNGKAESVIELTAHSIFRSRTQIGDQLTIERYEPKKNANRRYRYDPRRTAQVGPVIYFRGSRTSRAA